jgi:hypothetical protein
MSFTEIKVVNYFDIIKMVLLGFLSVRDDAESFTAVQDIVIFENGLPQHTCYTLGGY